LQRDKSSLPLFDLYYHVSTIETEIWRKVEFLEKLIELWNKSDKNGILYLRGARVLRILTDPFC